MRTFSVQAMVRDYHVYNLWDAACDNDILPCEREIGNPHDSSSIAVKKGIRSISKPAMFASNYYHRRYKFGIQRQNFGWVSFGDMTTIHQIRSHQCFTTYVMLPDMYVATYMLYRYTSYILGCFQL